MQLRTALAGLPVLLVALATGCVGNIQNSGTDGGVTPDGVGHDVVAHDAPGTDTPMGCAPALTMCGASCANLQSDPANCGTCGHACPTGQFCSAGACSASCSMITCGAACVNTQTDPANCGTCGHACAAGASCAAGACGCAPGRTSCGGACVDVTTDAANCGSCGHACAGGGACAGGTCACGAGLMACGTSCVNVTTDSANCGSCGNACTGGMHCMGATCMAGVVCPGAQAGVSADAAAALSTENAVRSAMGIGCATMVTTANAGADRHCQYYLANRSNSACTGNAHVEVSTCGMFYAANFWERMQMAGYTGSPAFEDMAFDGNGTAAVQQWIDSIWHRTPILSPWVRDIGYGGGGGMPCDTMDFGTGAATPATVTATYPYANQTNVPVSFDGRYEGPTPPAPPSGWPSGYPIHIYIRGTITAHDITLDGSSTTIPHVWLQPTDANTMGLLTNEGYVLYTNAPLAAATRYHVTATGTNSAGAVSFDWVFTTR